jgi:hypothetical protein
VRQKLTGILTAVAWLVLVAPSLAATPVGSPNLAAASEAPLECADPNCPLLVILERVGGTQVSTPAGVIVKWRFKGEGALTLVAYRPSERTSESLRAARVGATSPATGAGTGTVVEATTRIPVAQGDMIGVSVPQGGKLFGRATTDETAGWLALENPPNTIVTQGTLPGEVFYQADVEPDADGDGYGDESQDGCPADKTKQGPCGPPPPPPPPPPAALSVATLRTSSVKASKTGTVAISLKNPNSYAVSGTIALKQGTKSVGSAKFSLAPRASKRVAAKLSKAARATLKRKRKLTLKLTILTRGPAGTKSQTKTLTVKPA